MPHYVRDQSLEDLAKDIIEKTRPLLGHVKITCMFRPEAPVSDGKATAGMCIRTDDRNRTIHDQDFIIEIAKDIWEHPDTTDEFRRALMDHELGHAGIRTDDSGDVIYDETTNRPKTYIKKHDIEEFEDVLERHGAYHKNLRNFLEAFARSKAKKKTKKEEEDLIDADNTDIGAELEAAAE